MVKKKTPTNVRDVIMEKMNSEGRKLTWLAKQTKIPYYTLDACLKRNKFSVSDKNLKKINLALGTEFKP